MWKTISYSSFSYDSETLSALVIYGDSFVYGLRRMGFINNWKKINRFNLLMLYGFKQFYILHNSYYLSPSF